jgi:DNA-binding transcriptional MerR regulator
MNERWRLEELAQLAGLALDAAPYDGQCSGRVREVPDARTIRYYTTIGILDRPLEMRGRTAYYGRRHLLQIVAVKRLQARGMSLVDIQKSIAGADTSSLKRWAAVPAGFWKTAMAQQAQRDASVSPDDLLKPAPGAGANAGRARFWATEPATARVQAGQSAAVAAKPAVVLSLASGVSLIIEGRQVGELDADRLNSVRPAIGGLLAALRRSGITQSDNLDGRKE